VLSPRMVASPNARLALPSDALIEAPHAARGRAVPISEPVAARGSPFSLNAEYVHQESLRGSRVTSEPDFMFGPGRRHSDLAGWLSGAHSILVDNLERRLSADMLPSHLSGAHSLCVNPLAQQGSASLSPSRLEPVGESDVLHVPALPALDTSFVSHPEADPASSSDMASAALKQLLAAATGDAEQGAWGALEAATGTAATGGHAGEASADDEGPMQSSVRFAVSSAAGEAGSGAGAATAGEPGSDASKHLTSLLGTQRVTFTEVWFNARCTQCVLASTGQ
jgi:hypothetical protein